VEVYFFRPPIFVYFIVFLILTFGIPFFHSMHNPSFLLCRTRWILSTQRRGVGCPCISGDSL